MSNQRRTTRSNGEKPFVLAELTALELEALQAPLHQIDAIFQRHNTSNGGGAAKSSRRICRPERNGARHE